MTTPAVRRIQVGHLLRHIREEAGLDLKSAAAVIGKGDSTMSRIERGGVAMATHVLRKLLLAYREIVPKAVDVDWIIELARGSHERGRWSGYRSIYSKYFRMAVDLEEDASAIRQYQNEIVPGLVQTEGYIRALFSTALVQVADQATEDAIEARLERQAVLTKRKPPKVSFVLSESAIRRMIGTEAIMRTQLRHLAQVAELRNVQLQVLPFRARTAPRATYEFNLYRIPGLGTSGPLEFVYIEEYTDGRYLDEHEDVAAYTELWDQLVAAALDPVESRDFILSVAEEFT